MINPTTLIAYLTLTLSIVSLSSCSHLSRNEAIQEIKKLETTLDSFYLQFDELEQIAEDFRIYLDNPLALDLTASEAAKFQRAKELMQKKGWTFEQYKQKNRETLIETKKILTQQKDSLKKVYRIYDIMDF